MPTALINYNIGSQWPSLEYRPSPQWYRRTANQSPVPNSPSALVGHRVARSLVAFLPSTINGIESSVPLNCL